MSDSETAEPDRENEPVKAGRTGSPWAKVFWLFVILIASALIVFLSFIWLGKQGIDSTKEAAVEIVKAFRPDVVVETFEEWRALEAKGTEGNILEVATATSTEKFSRKTNLAMFGKTLPLGTTVSELTVPATYRYHIDLNGDWFVTSDGNRLLVLAPRVQPSFPVAFDSAGVQKKTKSGWARWDSGANMEELEKSVTAKLNERAAREESIAKVRDEAREAVAKFVRTWLTQHQAWDDRQFTEIVVLFEEEKGKSLSTMPATLQLEGAPVEEPVLP
jgi:hypothetical protein